jgi:glycosyltransferase involved in cell wall biosynthesis
MNIHIVMPAYNEGSGIEDFIKEIFSIKNENSLKVTVIDDCSTDKTIEALERLKKQFEEFTYFVNRTNLGHGPSTILAIRAGLQSGSEYVCTVDGDGQFPAKEIYNLINETAKNPNTIGEGVRKNRKEPVFRVIVTFTTRILVRINCGQSPRDANTPLRVYPAALLTNLVDGIPQESRIPNLKFSAIARTEGLNIIELGVNTRVRRGGDPLGSTWNQKRKNLPSRNFIKFCKESIFEWFEFSKRKT